MSHSAEDDDDAETTTADAVIRLRHCAALLDEAERLQRRGGAPTTARVTAARYDQYPGDREYAHAEDPIGLRPFSALSVPVELRDSERLGRDVYELEDLLAAFRAARLSGRSPFEPTTRRRVDWSHIEPIEWPYFNTRHIVERRIAEERALVPPDACTVLLDAVSDGTAQCMFRIPYGGGGRGGRTPWRVTRSAPREFTIVAGRANEFELVVPMPLESLGRFVELGHLAARVGPGGATMLVEGSVTMDRVSVRMRLDSADPEHLAFWLELTAPTPYYAGEGSSDSDYYEDEEEEQADEAE